jgi:NADH dehydrogenase
MEHVPQVVIVGGGFAGLSAVRALKRANVRVTMVDRRNHHLFQPLLYQVASAALNPSEIATPLRTMLRPFGAEVLLAEVTHVDLADKKVYLRDGELSYDYLVLASGAQDAYFGHADWAEKSFGLKSLEDALEIRRRILLAFEAAERETDPARRAAWLTFVLIGGGPTGVEMAGALAEISRHALVNDFQHIDPSQARIVLLEGLPRVLPSYPESLSEAARRSLEKKGVQVRTGAKVTRLEEDAVYVGEERIPTRTILWSAGVEASPLARSLEIPLAKGGRVKVTKELTVPGHPEVFVVGDLALVEDRHGRPVPGVAPAAMQMGKSAGRNIARAVRGEPLEPFSYFDRGTFSVIGRGSAVGLVLGKFRMSGFFAWLAWLFIHITFLIGFRNKLLVLFDWAYQYLTFRRGARLITAASRDASEAPMYVIHQPPPRRALGDGHGLGEGPDHEREAPLPPAPH